MSAVLPRSPATAVVDRLKLATPALPQAACPDRAVDGLAVFFDSETGAQEAVRHLAQLPAVHGARLELLRPQDSGWLRFARLSSNPTRRGSTPRWQRDPWMFMLLGGMSGALTASVALLVGNIDIEGILQSLALSVLAGVSGAAIGAVLVGASAYLPPYDHFDGVVRKRLAAGQWAVRLRSIPWAGQPELFGWLRAQRVHWYATATRPSRV